MTKILNGPPRMMRGATATENGAAGYVPTPTAGNETTEFLRKDGTWAQPPASDGSGGYGPGYSASSNDAGNTTIAVSEAVGAMVAFTTLSGAGATTRIFILDVSADPPAGTTIVHRVAVPATADITLEWRDASDTGALLTSFVSDGSGDDLVAEFFYNGSAWNFLRFTYPANA